MQIAIGENGKAASKNLIEKIGPTRHFPSIELVSQLLAPIPEVIGLFFSLSRPNRMRGNRQSALLSDRATYSERVLIRRYPVLRTNR